MLQQTPSFCSRLEVFKLTWSGADQNPESRPKPDLVLLSFEVRDWRWLWSIVFKCSLHCFYFLLFRLSFLQQAHSITINIGNDWLPHQTSNTSSVSASFQKILYAKIDCRDPSLDLLGLDFLGGGREAGETWDTIFQDKVKTNSETRR